MKIESLLRLSVVIVLLPSTLQAQDTLRAKIVRLAKPYVESEVVVGMSIGVIHDGKETTLHVGRTDKKGRAPTDSTIYEIGSISKVFTGVMLADAVTRGKVELDQPAEAFLSEGVTMPSHNKTKITLKHLATHTSGLPRIPSNLKLPSDNPYAKYNVVHLFEFLNKHELARAPGQKYDYSNVGAGLLGTLIAAQQKTSYEQLLLDRIAKPLGLTDTVLTLADKQRPRFATPHNGEGKPVSSWEFDALAGAGGIRSTLADMMKFAKVSLDPPKNDIGKALDLAWKTHQPPLSKGQPSLGLGWHIFPGGELRYHSGQTGGFHSILLVDRTKKAAIVLLTNSATYEVERLAQSIGQTLDGNNVEPRTFGVQVPLEDMKRYVGKYQLTPKLVFTVTVEGKKLMVGLTGQPTHRVYPKSKAEWEYRVVPAKLVFQLDKEGKCTAVELHQGGITQKAKRIE